MAIRDFDMENLFNEIDACEAKLIELNEMDAKRRKLNDKKEIDASDDENDLPTSSRTEEKEEKDEKDNKEDGQPLLFIPSPPLIPLTTPPLSPILIPNYDSFPQDEPLPYGGRIISILPITETQEDINNADLETLAPTEIIDDDDIPSSYRQSPPPSPTPSPNPSIPDVPASLLREQQEEDRRTGARYDEIIRNNNPEFFAFMMARRQEEVPQNPVPLRVNRRETLGDITRQTDIQENSRDTFPFDFRRRYEGGDENGLQDRDYDGRRYNAAISGEVISDSDSEEDRMLTQIIHNHHRGNALRRMRGDQISEENNNTIINLISSEEQDEDVPRERESSVEY